MDCINDCAKPLKFSCPFTIPTDASPSLLTLCQTFSRGWTTQRRGKCTACPATKNIYMWTACPAKKDIYMCTACTATQNI